MDRTAPERATIVEGRTGGAWLVAASVLFWIA